MASIRMGLVFLACVVSFITESTRADAQEHVVGLVGGRIIDGTGAPSRAGETILIRGDRIVAIGRDVAIPAGATVIDVSGKTVIPGLVDMHGHMYARATVEIVSQFDAYPLLYLAGGVTTVASPGDLDPDGMIALRDRIARGDVIGPRIFTAGPYFDNEPSQVGWIEGVLSAEEALRKFEQWKGRIDFVKFYTGITDDQMRAVIGPARAAGMPVTGDLASIPAGRAIELGITGIEHGIFSMTELSGDGSRDRDCVLATLDLDSPLVESLVTSIVQHRVAIDPTMVIFQAVWPEFEAVTPDWLDYMSPAAREHQTRLLTAAPRTDPTGAGCAARALETQRRFVKKVHDRGGLIVAGTDPVSPRLIPGYGLHRELKNLVDAGLSPLDAIRAATHNAAVALRREDEFGTIAVGKRADLVVVSGDPAARIEDIGNTEIVFKAGVRHDPAALRREAKGRVR